MSDILPFLISFTRLSYLSNTLSLSTFPLTLVIIASSLAASVTDGNAAAGIATGVIAAINSDGTGDYTAAATGGNGNAFYVTKAVSASGQDTSPLITLSSFPSISFEAAGSTTTAVLTPDGYTTVSVSNLTLIDGTATEVNSLGSSNSLYSLTSGKSLLSGLRITLTNDGSVGMGTVGISMGVSNTGIINTVTDLDSSIAAGLMAAGTNIATFGGSNGRFVVPVSGDYAISYFNMIYGVASGTGVVEWNIKKNGSDNVLRAYQAANGSYWSNMGCSGIVSLSASDYITIECGAASASYDGHGGNYSGFSMHLVG